MTADIEDMSLIELKKLAKTKKIKQYYIMKRAELIELLMMEELPFKLRLQKMTISEMRTIAKQRGMRGFWSLSKDQLCDRLFGGSSHDEEKDNSKTSEHKDPKYKDSDEIRVDVTEYTLEKRFDNMSL
jgi:hypothetical protein